jgi:gas vesicle protein
MNRKPKYARWGIALGAALGAVAGMLAGNVGVWLAVGVAIGVAIGWSARPKTSQCPECEALHRTHRLRSRANSQMG